MQRKFLAFFFSGWGAEARKQVIPMPSQLSNISSQWQTFSTCSERYQIGCQTVQALTGLDWPENPNFPLSTWALWLHTPAFLSKVPSIISSSEVLFSKPALSRLGILHQDKKKNQTDTNISHLHFTNIHMSTENKGVVLPEWWVWDEQFSFQVEKTFSIWWICCLISILIIQVIYTALLCADSPRLLSTQCLMWVLQLCSALFCNNYWLLLSFQIYSRILILLMKTNTTNFIQKLF